MFERLAPIDPGTKNGWFGFEEWLRSISRITWLGTGYWMGPFGEASAHKRFVGHSKVSPGMRFSHDIGLSIQVMEHSPARPANMSDVRPIETQESGRRWLR